MRIALPLALAASALAGAAHAQGYRLARPGPAMQAPRPTYSAPAARGWYGPPGGALALSRRSTVVRPGGYAPRPQGGVVRSWGRPFNDGRYGERRVFRSYRPQVYAYVSPGYSAYSGYGAGYYGSSYYGSAYYGSGDYGYYAPPAYSGDYGYAYPQARYGYGYGEGGYAPAYAAQDYGYSAYGPNYAYGPTPPYASGGYRTGYAPVPPCACGW